MASRKQIQANRQNALKSTGPKTPEGKDSARLNSTKHGLLSQEVLPGEDEEARKELAERLRAELQPVGEMENLLVERIIDATWRLRRLSRVEAGIFTWELYEELAQRAQEEAQTYEFYMGEGPSLTGITDEQKHQEAISKAEEMKSKQHRAETATLGRTFIRDADTANAFSKL